MMKPIQKQRTFTKNNFAEHNYNYEIRLQTSKSFRPNKKTRNHLFSQRQNFGQPITTSVNSHDYTRNSLHQSENYPFFQQSKNNEQNHVNTLHLTIHLIIYHQMMMIIINQIF